MVDSIQTPLHTTLAALLVAAEHALPAARSKLFEEYFRTILKRERGKSFEHGIQEADEGVLRMLHERAGLALHVRSQEQQGARSALRRRELRAILTQIYAELGVSGEEVRANVDRLMRFAAERLVLLLHAAEGDYTFGVRSLQEFFAAEALCRTETEKDLEQLQAIALDPHWSNVLAFVVSRLALETTPPSRERARQNIVSLCRALNDGTLGGEVAARGFLGSRLAIALLRETSRYGLPWLQDSLWEIALKAAAAPVQSRLASVARIMSWRHRGGIWTNDVETHTRLGLLAASSTGSQGDRRRLQVMKDAEAQLAKGGAERLNGWRLLHGLLVAEVPDAIRLANAFAPTTGEDAREVLGAMRDEPGAFLPRWLHGFIDQHETWFSPRWGRWAFRNDDENQALIFKVARALFLGRRWISLTWEGIQGWHGGLVSVETDVADWRTLEPRLPDKTPAWVLWKRIAKFLMAPSHGALADILEAAEGEEAFEELKSSPWYALPWPIQVCFRYIPNCAAAPALAARVRDGKLGSIEDWLAAEARWRQSSHVALEEVSHWLEADGPWNSDIAHRGLIVLGTCLPPQIGRGPAGSQRDRRRRREEDVGRRPAGLAALNPELAQCGRAACRASS